MDTGPLLSIKEAATLLNLDKKSVRERLVNGQLIGEKKTIGEKEKWFVHSGSVQKTLARRRPGYVEPADDNQFQTMVIEHKYESSFNTISDLSFDDAENQDQTHMASPHAELSLAQVIVATPVRHDASTMTRGEWYQEERARVEEIIEQVVTEQILQPLLDQLSADASRQIMAASQSKIELETALHQEIARLQETMTALNQQVESLKRPWWKKLFNPF